MDHVHRDFFSTEAELVQSGEGGTFVSRRWSQRSRPMTFRRYVVSAGSAGSMAAVLARFYVWVSLARVPLIEGQCTTTALATLTGRIERCLRSVPELQAPVHADARWGNCGAEGVNARRQSRYNRVKLDFPQLYSGCAARAQSRNRRARTSGGAGWGLRAQVRESGEKGADPKCRIPSPQLPSNKCTTAVLDVLDVLDNHTNIWIIEQGAFISTLASPQRFLSPATTRTI